MDVFVICGFIFSCVGGVYTRWYEETECNGIRHPCQDRRGNFQVRQRFEDGQELEEKEDIKVSNTSQAEENIGGGGENIGGGGENIGGGGENIGGGGENIGGGGENIGGGGENIGGGGEENI
ncbi:hypothetical protein T02_4228, partial [Trichinella nativa]